MIFELEIQFQPWMERKLIFIFLVTIDLLMASQIPTLTLQSTIYTYNYSAFPTDTCRQMQLTSNFIFRLGSNNVIEIFEKNNYSNKSEMLNFTYTFSNGVLNTPSLINTFSVDSKEKYLILSQMNSTKMLNLMNFTLKMKSNISPFTAIFLNNLTLTGLTQDINGVNKFYQSRYPSQAAFDNSGTIIFSVSSSNIKNMSGCKSSRSPSYRQLVFWDKYSNIYVYNYTDVSILPEWLGSITHNILSQNLTQSIQFSADSKYFIIEADGQLPVKIVSLNPDSLLTQRSFYFNATITKAMFMDKDNKYIILFNTTGYTIIDVTTLVQIYTVSLSISTNIIEADYLAAKFYVCQDNNISVYNILTPAGNCTTNCNWCSESACLICNPGYILQNGSCILNITANNQLTNNNSQTYSVNETNTTNTMNSTNTSNTNITNANYSYSNNSSLNSNKNSSNQQNQTNLTSTQKQFYFLIYPDGSFVILDINQYQAIFLNFTQKALTYTNYGLEKLMIILNSSPFIYLFLGNLQFFTICSFYALLYVPIPVNILNTLISTSVSLNANIFSLLGMSISVPPLASEQIGDNKFLQFGVSSLFLPNNYQYICINMAIIIIILLLQAILKQSQGYFKQIYIFIKMNKFSIFSGIFISGFVQFLLPYNNVIANLGCSDLYSKINQSLQFLICGLIIIFCGIFAASAGYIGSYSKILSVEIGEKPQKYSSLYNIWRKRDTIYIMIVNLLFSLLVGVADPLYFLSVNMVVLFCGFRKSCFTKIKRVNKMIMSFYPLLFHFCFIIFYFAESERIIVITEVICLIVYFLGSIHQFIIIIFEMLSSLCKKIFKKCKEKNEIKPQNQPPSCSNQNQASKWYWKFSKKQTQQAGKSNKKFRANTYYRKKIIEQRKIDQIQPYLQQSPTYLKTYRLHHSFKKVSKFKTSKNKNKNSLIIKK